MNRDLMNKMRCSQKSITLFSIVLTGAMAFFAFGAHCASEVRYLSSSGDDKADGKTPETAWRTIERANAALPRGATLRLKCGDTFYGGLTLPSGLDAAHPTVLTSWGEGPKPVISATKVLKPKPSIWQDLTHCYWRVNIANPSNYTGLITDDCNPGFLLVDSEVKPWKRFCHADLVSPWDFCGKDGWLYVHAEKNPATLSKDIRVALRVHCVQFASHSIISNVAVKATGAHAMHAGWGCDVNDVRIADCEFENIGGSELLGFSPHYRIRFGNGIELGGDAKDVIIERCSFRGVYDVCFTMQGYPKKGWRDIHCRDCTMTDCTQAFEIWCKRAPKGVGFERCSFAGNRTLRVGGGWGALVRPKRDVATPLLIYDMHTDTVDIAVTGNTFESVSRGLIFKSGGADKIPQGYRIYGNTVK